MGQQAMQDTGGSGSGDLWGGREQFAEIIEKTQRSQYEGEPDQAHRCGVDRGANPRSIEAVIRDW